MRLAPTGRIHGLMINLDMKLRSESPLYQKKLHSGDDPVPYCVTPRVMWHPNAQRLQISEGMRNSAEISHPNHSEKGRHLLTNKPGPSCQLVTGEVMFERWSQAAL